MSLCVSGDKVAKWIQDANAKEQTGREMELKAHTGAAMAHYLVAGRLLTVALDVIQSCNGELESKTREAVCKTESTEIHCKSNDNTAFQSWLSGRIRTLHAKAEEMSRKYCSERQQLLGAAGGDGNGDGEESWSTCHAGLRSTIEHTMNAGDDLCSKAWFDLILGQQQAKDGLRNGFMMPLLYPNLFAKQSRAVLLYGSPGTGKTLLAKAVANELSQNSRVRMLMFAPQHSDIKSKFVGESEQKITQIFKCASKWASEAEKSLAECLTPDGKKKSDPPRVMAIVFLDEVEVLAGDRASDKSGFGGATLNTLLQEMDGIKSHDNVVVVAATNYPWQLDAAFLRRFSKRIFVELPNDQDIFKYVNMEISNAIFGFDADKGKPSQKEKSAPSTKASCNVCTSGEKKSAMDRNDPDAFTKNAAVAKFVRNLDPGQLRSLCKRFADNRYSLSDMSNVMAAVMQMAGQEGLRHGTFVKEEIRLGDKSNDVYVSTLCYDQDALKDKIIFSIPEPDVTPGYMRTLTIGTEKFVHYSSHPFGIPAGSDARVLDNSIFVRDDGATKKDVVVKLALRASPTAGDTTQPSDAGTAEQVKAIANKLANHGPAVSWEDLRKAAESLHMKASDVANTWGMHAAGDTSRIEYIYMRATIDLSPGAWSRFLNAMPWVTTRQEDQKATVIKNIETQGIVSAMLDMASTVQVYSTWGCEEKDVSRLVAKFNPNAVNRDDGDDDPITGQGAQPVKDKEYFENMLQEGVPVLDGNLFDPNKSLLHGMCDGACRTAADVSFVLAEKPIDVSAKRQLLPSGQESKLVNWNYEIRHFASVCKDVPSSADPRMIKLLEEYAKNPAKILDCMTASTRPELPAECAKLVGKIPAATSVCID